MDTVYEITEDDYVRAMKLYSKITPKIAVIYALVAAVLVLLVLFGSPVLKGGAIGGLIGCVIAVVLGRFIVNSVLARRHYRKYKAIHEPIHIQLKDEGIELSTTDERGLVRWEKILKWRQNKNYVLVYPMPRMYHIIPKSIEGSGFDMRSLIAALGEKVGNET